MSFRSLLVNSLMVFALCSIPYGQFNQQAQLQASTDVVVFSDPSLRERYYHLVAELRCPKCQNQNLADSNAPISKI